MYNNFINKEVILLVSSRAEAMWEYSGILCEENDNFLKLKNVQISQVMLNVQRNIFGAGMGSYMQNIDEVILNKNYIVACYKR